MITQPEQVLEHNLLSQLDSLGHRPILIKTEKDFLENLKMYGSNIYKIQVYQNLGVTINPITGSALKKFKIPFSSKQEQTKIATFLSAFNAKIDTVRTTITPIQDFKKGLFRLLFV